MTQHELIIEYLKEFGNITPAKMGGKIYKGQMIGSEASARCRELRKPIPLRKLSLQKYPQLYSFKEGKFEVFTIDPLLIHLLDLREIVLYENHKQEDCPSWDTFKVYCPSCWEEIETNPIQDKNLWSDYTKGLEGFF